MKFTAEISENETFFSQTVVYRGTTFNEKWEKGILDVKTHFKRNLTVYTFSPLIIHQLLIKRTCCTNEKPWESYEQTPLRTKYFRFEKRLMDEASHTIFKEKLLLEVKLTERKAALLKQNNKKGKEILPFVTQYQPLVSIIKEALMKKWNLIQNQPLPWQNFKEPPKVLYLWERKIMAKDMLVGAKT